MSIKRTNESYITWFSWLCYLNALWQAGVGAFHLVVGTYTTIAPYAFIDTAIFGVIGFLNQKVKSRIIGIITCALLIFLYVASFVAVHAKNHLQSPDYIPGDSSNVPTIMIVLFLASVRSTVAIFKYRKDQNYFKQRNKNDRNNS